MGMAGVVSRRGLVVGVAGSLAAPAVRAQPAVLADADAVPDEEAFTPTLAAPTRPIPVGPERHIWIINNANEEVAVAYRSGEAHDALAMSRLQNAFRDLREQTPGPLPELLIDMLSLLQEKYRYTRPLRVISGYRTLRTNMSLEHAAPNSFHLYGYAADFYMPGVPVLDLAIEALALSRRFGFMGVGFYRQFVHMDVGPARTWTNFAA